MKLTARFSIICAIIVMGVFLALFSTSAMSASQDYTPGAAINSDGLIQNTDAGLVAIPMVDQEADDEYADEDEEAYDEEEDESEDAYDDESYDEDETSDDEEEAYDEDVEEDDDELAGEEAEDQNIDDEESEDIQIEEE